MRKTIIIGGKLRVYKFDWDNNILNLPTKIKLYKNGNPLYVSTNEYAELRNNPEYQIKSDAFEDFRDYGLRGENAFIEDTIKAIKGNNTAPSFKKFKEALIYCNFFAIITARGHAPETIKRGVSVFISLALSVDEKITFRRNLKNLYGDLPYIELINTYLNEQKYYPVSSEQFQKQFGSLTGADKPELAKQIASKDFIEYIENVSTKLGASDIRIVKPKSKGDLSISFGFSDDDKLNVKSMKDFMGKIKFDKPHINFIVYDTSNPNKVKKIVIKRKKNKV
jgi:hypothetical protein